MKITTLSISNNKAISASLFLVPGLLIFLFYLFAFPYHLFLKEQIRLFVFSPDYLLSYLNKPASLAVFIGDFLTQFFYLKGAGSLLITTFFYIHWWLFYKVLKEFFSKNYLLLVIAFVPALIEVLMHYHIDYSLANSASITIGCLLYVATTSIKKETIKHFIVPFIIIIGYWAIGGMVVFYIFLTLIRSIRIQPFKLIYSLIHIVLFIAIPLLTRPYYLIPIKEAYLYPFNNFTYALPLITLSFVIVTSVLTKKFTPGSRFSLVVSILVMFTFILVDPPNFNREKVLSLSCEGYFGRWDKVLNLSSSYKLNNKLASYYTNIALSKYESLPEKLLEFYQPFTESLFLPLGRNSGWLNILSSNDAYYQIGDMNLTQHSAHLGLIFSPYNRSSRMVKRLAETNMVIGEEEAAMKYLHMLEKTLFHHKWAQKRIDMIQNPELLSNDILEKQSFLPQSDTLRKGEDNVTGLRLLVESNPKNRSALDYLLCHHLLSKNLNSFKTDFEKYFRFNRQLPRLYGEALLIILYQQKATKEEISKFFIQSSLMNEFIKYTDEYSLANGQRTGLSNRFKNSYWFYYHFAQQRQK
ncbi:DUF6057 family protein [Carboxylicivirga linearis]|uniref:Transmembrane protein n=1 Tax=Carboxylicivirga linearis TaxID=1628157 RepID=A0ABS5JTQ6_9BACT|nr:DUF6057 family protein [Carboxylicivirga linearis]MBS2098298.1 hypothetical protein [Carboxylicivirga linearis]